MTYIYRNVTVDRVVDADTLKVTIDFGFCIKHSVTLRIKNYDAPEAQTLPGDAATVRTKELLPVASKIIVETFKPTADIFARYTANVTLLDGRDYAQIMILEGHVK